MPKAVLTEEREEMSTTTKNDLVKEVMRRTGCTKVLAEQVVESFFTTMRESLMDGNRIEIRGFGVWTVRWKNPNPNARNPKTGEAISVPARRHVHFKPGRVLKEALSEPVEE